MSSTAVPAKVSVTVRSVANVLPLAIATDTTDTFSATPAVAPTSDSRIDAGTARSESAGTSSSSVIVTGYVGVGEHAPARHVVPSG